MRRRRASSDEELEERDVDPAFELAAHFVQTTDLAKAEAFVQRDAPLAGERDHRDERVYAVRLGVLEQALVECRAQPPAAVLLVDVDGDLARRRVGGPRAEGAVPGERPGPAVDLGGEDPVPVTELLEPPPASLQIVRLEVERGDALLHDPVVDADQVGEVFGGRGADVHGGAGRSRGLLPAAA